MKNEKKDQKKAVLILDKVPKTCKECPLIVEEPLYGAGRYYCPCKHEFVFPDALAGDCPLLVKPEFHPCSGRFIGTIDAYQSFDEGWNDALGQLERNTISKSIEKKPIIVDNGYGNKVPACPTCGHIIMHSDMHPELCIYCSQSLNWGDEERYEEEDA